MADESKKVPIKEASDQIYNMYEDSVKAVKRAYKSAAKSGALGSRAKVQAENEEIQATWYTGKNK